MQAMILAAGLGTRLRPWTLTHPKALVPVCGVPMLERVIENLRKEGFDRIVVNVHHFSSQIKDFLESRDFGVDIQVSDETECLLDTGGGILHASRLFRPEPVLVHNVDILSNAGLGRLMRAHEESGADSTLLVSDRESGRKLVFDGDMSLRGWHNVRDGSYRPDGFVPEEGMTDYAFSGIHVVGERMLDEMRRICRCPRFSVIDFLLSRDHRCDVRGYMQAGLKLIDIGKPETLKTASEKGGICG